jgi:hypothetical protein
MPLPELRSLRATASVNSSASCAVGILQLKPLLILGGLSTSKLLTEFTPSQKKQPVFNIE